MKRVLKLSGLTIVAYLLLVKTGLLSTMALFFLVGMVPGTDYVLSPFSTILATLVAVVGVSGCINQSFGKVLMSLVFRSNPPAPQLPRRSYKRVSATRTLGLGHN